MTGGELVGAAALGVLAPSTVIIAGLTDNGGYAFHMAVFAIASAIGFFAILNRWFDQTGGPQPLEIGGKPNFNDAPIKVATIAAMFWGIAGFSVGLIIALQLAFPALNLDLPWTTFGRMRPLHTSAVIFAFGGNVLIGTAFYVVQRTCRARLFGDLLPWFVVLGYNLFIVVAGTGYLLGITQGKEYAEPEWYADLFLTIVWVAFLAVFWGTVVRRKEPHIYVANWFYMGFIVTIAVLHLGNNAAIPVSILSPKSYIVWSGVQDAMFQWWYGHNAVGFFLTAGFLGIMYYFIPKRAERPVYSYRLSIIHFWALIFLYIWAGPHHLHYTALPDVGADPGRDLLHHAVDALVGRHDQRPDDALGRMGQAAHGSLCSACSWCPSRFTACRTFEGPVMSIKRGQLAVATTPTGPSATCTPARWAGSAS